MRTDDDIQTDAQEIVNEVWAEIGFDPRLAISVVSGLIDSCLKSAGPDRAFVSQLIQFNFVERPALERAN